MSARIGIVGAGAIGGWIGVRLAASGHQVSVLARGATLAALRERPWRLLTAGRDMSATVLASDDAASLGPQDILLITLKGPALPGLAPALRPMIGDHTAIVTAMNGVPWWFLLGGGGGELGPTPLRSVDPDGNSAANLPYGQVVGCVVHAAASVSGPGEVRHTAGNKIIIGEPGGRVGLRLPTVAAAFEEAGFEVERSGAIERDIWYKLWGNMTMNTISAITGATCDRILDDPLVNDFVLRVMEEAKAIGARIGVKIDECGEARNAVTRRLGAIKTSMLQDVEAGRAIELDQLLGAPLEIASRLGMAAPHMETLFGMTRLFGVSRGLYGTRIIA
jgi:2-dehydropantoate 2-reductase